MSTSDTDARVAVKTYVPEEQKHLWEDHAAEMNMTMSEFIRTMVQSGRSPFTVERTPSSDGNPGGNGLEEVILDVLQDGPATFDEISDEIIGDLEEQIDQTLMEMDEVVVSGRTGQYRLNDQ